MRTQLEFIVSANDRAALLRARDRIDEYLKLYEERQERLRRASGFRRAGRA